MANNCHNLRGCALPLAAAITFNVVGIGNAIASEEHSLSALQAQGASRRFDTEVGFIDSRDADELSWGFQYTSVLREKHQLTAVLPLIDPDVSGRIALRSGDLALEWVEPTRVHAVPAI